jgi:hypothetical protein
MRYLLHNTQLHELAGRQEYLYDIFQMYFLPGQPEGNYIPLMPMGTSGPDILFITGHANTVWNFLSARINQIPEKTIVITSCLGYTFGRFASKKDIYVPDLRQAYCELHSGEPYGFSFPISDAELNFYNATGDIWTRVQHAYVRLPDKEKK